MMWSRIVGAQPADMELLYHCNLGPPLLETGSKFVAPVRRLVPATPRAAVGIDTVGVYAAPTAGFAEQVYLYDLYANEAGETLTLLHNAAGTLGLALRFNLNQLPCFTQWKNTGAIEDGYVTGIEPGTNYPNFRSYERQQGRLMVLPPGGRWECRWSMEVCGSASEVEAAKGEIESLQQGLTARVSRTPQPGFSLAGDKSA